ncbi:cell division cycle 48C [Perilla frutescens var. frutescens]|nr:cell division cycle 48C [Perilla frutescens var. frutescens]
MESQNVPGSHVEPPAAAAGENGSNLAELSHCAYLESCCRGKLLTERVENNTPLLRGRNVAIDEFAPITKKRGRRKRPRIVVSSNLVDASSSEKDDSSDRWEIERSESDVLGVDRRNKNGNGGGGRNRVMFRDLGGISGVIEELETEVIVPLHQVKLLRHLGVEPVARILLQGPPGCGKTTLARAIANEAGLPFYEVSAAELVSGAFEENIRELFSKAYVRAPSIVFIDEIDSITSIKDNPLKEIESRIVNRLMACMDESCRLIKPVNHDTGSVISNSTCGYVLVIGATSRLDAVDPTLRQQLDREIVLGVPDESARLEILSVLTCNLKVEVGCDLAKIARSTMGFVGRDLVALAKKAGILAVNRIVHKRNLEISKKSDCFIIRKDIEGNTRPPFSDEEMEKFSITMEDFKGAIRTVQPSSKMEEFYTIPNAKWDDVVGLQSLKQEFDCHIIRPIKFPDVYKDLGRDSTTTFFLYGPSGCGKTLIVKALANEAGANFIHIKCLELHTYTDHSKLVLQNIISNARTWSPCILFFDGVRTSIY